MITVVKPIRRITMECLKLSVSLPGSWWWKLSFRNICHALEHCRHDHFSTRRTFYPIYSEFETSKSNLVLLWYNIPPIYHWSKIHHFVFLRFMRKSQIYMDMKKSKIEWLISEMYTFSHNIHGNLFIQLGNFYSVQRSHSDDVYRAKVRTKYGGS